MDTVVLDSVISTVQSTITYLMPVAVFLIGVVFSVTLFFGAIRYLISKARP